MKSNELSPIPKIFFWVLISMMIVFLWMLFGCNTTQKAFDKVSRPQNKQQLAELCADKFAPRDSIVYKDSIRFDTIYTGQVVWDTLYYNTGTDTVKMIVTKEVPKIVTKTVTQVKEVYRENTAQVEALKGKLNECDVQKSKLFTENEQLKMLNKKYKAQRNKAYAWWLIIAALAVGYIFRGKIFSLISKVI